MWTCVALVALVATAGAVTRDQFYPHGPSLDQTLPKGHEVPSAEVTLKVPVLFYGEVYESIFVNNHGVLSFRADIPQFLNIEFPLPYPSIAAFYTNVDTSDHGDVFYRETDEPHVITKAEESVQNNFHDYYDFKPTSVFIATWVEVTYTGASDRRNSFQVAIISNGTESFVELLYPERDIQWIQRQTDPSSLPDAKAQAGFIAEDGRVLTLRGSGSQQIRNIVSWSNTQEPGKYVYRIGDIAPNETVAVPDQYNQSEAEIEEESKTCAQSGPSVCHVQARCVDYQAGICCQCNEGFYGNGKSCIKDDVPLRVHGKLNGVINNINLNDVDIQSYVVVADGRAYTALSLTPPSLGSSLQFLNVLGNVVGWLFAKPSGTAKNGYQLTGALFNYTADIWFPATGDRVTISQEYLGHDVFDQITIETDVRGTIPVIVPGIKLDISGYDEQYSIIEPGTIRSDSTRTFTNTVTGESYVQKVSQTFTYSPCRYAPPSEEDSVPLTLKVGKNYLGYQVRENIVRYGSSNKISPLGQEDPCIEGQHSCGPHSTCVVQGDTFACVCKKGYSNIYINQEASCVDVDECAAGIHNCDSNADCYNQDGDFQCRCREGFEGNGVTCKMVSRCQNLQCGTNAQCIENYGDVPFQASCVCNPGYTGDGVTCYPAYDYACDHCSPYATCVLSEITNQYSCRCNTGFSGDGINCSPTPADTTPVPSQQELHQMTAVPLECDSYSCSCPPGLTYFVDENNNAMCRYEIHLTERPQPESRTPRSEPHVYQSEDQVFTPRPPPQYVVPQVSISENPVHINVQENPQPEATTGNNPIPSYPVNEDNPPQYYPTEYSPSEYYPPENTTPRVSTPEHSIPSGTDTDASGDRTHDCTAPGNMCSAPAPTTQENMPVDNSDPYLDNSDTSIRCRSDTDCPPNAVCSPDSSNPSDEGFIGHCVCPEGYEGDAYECIERTGATCSCGPNAHCTETIAADLLCVCNSGYHGDGYICRPNLSCSNNSDCEYNAECRPDPTSNENVCQCIDGFVKDQNEACIPDGQLCNGALCAEHASCLYDDTLEINFCHCDDGFDGDGISQCVPVGHTCEVANDCSLDAVCTPFENSYQCVCRDGFVGDGYTCNREISCRTDPYLCSPHASCLQRNDNFECECNKGYNGNGTTCELNPRLEGNFLVTSDGTSVYRVPFSRSPRDYATPLNSGATQVAVAVEVDCLSGRVYWGDVVNNNIQSVAYDGSNYEQFLTLGIKSPEGIAIDWSARNIFWTDSRKLTIEVANLDTKARKVLFAVEGIANPRGIAVHPQRGKIFWSDWNRSNPKIEWANMDGTQRGIFLDKTDVRLPNSVAIDWVRERLCYADAGLQSIKCVGIDTRDRETVAERCQYPFGLAINEHKFYWSDWRSLKIEYIDVESQTKGQIDIPKSTKRIYGVAVAASECPAAINVCMHRNGGCQPSQLCLPDGQGGRTCVDADNTYAEP